MALDPIEFSDIWDEGAEESGNPAGGPDGLTMPEYRNDPDRLPTMYQPFDVVALAQNAVQTLNAQSRPDYWIVSMDDTAAVGVSVYFGSGVGGVPIRFGSKGYAVLPAQSTQNSLTIMGTAAAPANLTVIAVRGLRPEFRRVA